jgi:hypothetical protein
MAGVFQVQVYVRVYLRWKRECYHQLQHLVSNHIQLLLSKVWSGSGRTLACHQTLMKSAHLTLLISLVSYTWTFKGIAYLWLCAAAVFVSDFVSTVCLICCVAYITVLSLPAGSSAICCNAISDRQCSTLVWSVIDVSIQALTNTNCLYHGMYTHSIYNRDVPYDYTTLLENVLDASHLPYTHHKVYTHMNYMYVWHRVLIPAVGSSIYMYQLLAQ